MEKTICILPQHTGLGGPASFQARLSAVLASRGYLINHDALDPTNHAILVIGGTRQLRLLQKAKQNGVRIIQRLNGMNWVHRQKFTGVKHFIRAEINNLILASIRNLADEIVYQSNFSRDWWESKRGATRLPGRVIYNGVDLDKYSPEGVENPPRDHFRLLMVEGSYGSGYEGGLETAFELLSLLQRRLDQPLELMVVGNVPNALREKAALAGLNAVTWMGVVKRDEVPAIDRSAHLLFSSDVNAACPNSVIEALACGLPVIGFDTGALAELVLGDAGKIARYGANPWKLQKPDVHALADAAFSVLSNQQTYRRAARDQAQRNFDIQKIADRYVEVLLLDAH